MDPNVNNSGDMTNYQVNGEFSLESFTSTYNLVYYSCCPAPYPDITYTIRIRRRPMFYVFNLILPCVLINGIGMYMYITLPYDKYDIDLVQPCWCSMSPQSPGRR